MDAVLSYLAVCPWTFMPPMAYFQVDQLTEVLLTNGGFIIITVLFIRNLIGESRKEFETLDLPDASGQEYKPKHRTISLLSIAFNIT
ncbi:hypothetical protein [Lunatibacter salilacus]|uniref:hypothetical protein n=1 Tax=Lunatibacter salilacus TaxID=2483804 RepID=UPI001F158748|nr:hypothetical protein [Lunatibacter salilacus]